MIKAAHVGIGISGQEGLQAVMSLQDYAIYASSLPRIAAFGPERGVIAGYRNSFLLFLQNCVTQCVSNSRDPTLRGPANCLYPGRASVYNLLLFLFLIIFLTVRCPTRVREASQSCHSGAAQCIQFKKFHLC